MSDHGALNLRWAWTLVDTLAGAGVRHAVLSPGSRSTPLTLACLRHPDITTHVRVDERGAAFFALGLARAGGAPALVVATSGTAVANWLPAVVEADLDRVPLVLLSADRPPELIGCGANQAIDQVKLFGDRVRKQQGLPLPTAEPAVVAALRAAAARAVAASRWPLAGPVHLNQPLREPLVPADPTPALPPPRPAPRAPQPVTTLPARETAALAAALSGRPGLIVAGRGPFPVAFPAAITRLARQLGCPILADPLSGLRFGPHDREPVLARYDAFLRRTAFTAACRPAWVLRCGDPPVSKALAGYLEGLEQAEQWLVADHGRWPDPQHRATALLRADPAWLAGALTAAEPDPAPAEWLAGFKAEEARALALAAGRAPAEARLLESLLGALPDGAALFVGNSLPIRDLDAFSGTGARRLRLHANRGASGIDGNLSTALGLAAADRARPATALVGDLTCYHDLNALHGAAALGLRLLVVNNGGGAIFRQLPQADLPEFESAWLTPVALDFRAVATLFGLPHHRVDAGEPTALAGILARPGAALVELVVDGAASHAARRDYFAAVAAD